MRLSNRLVMSGGGIPVCPIPIREHASQSIQVRNMTCCVQKVAPCIVQSAAKSFQFIDVATQDYSTASEITFDIWRSSISGANLLSYSLTGGEITLVNDYTFQLTIGNTDSAALPAGTHHCEAWVTLSGGERRCVGRGRFRVIDSRKHD